MELQLFLDLRGKRKPRKLRLLSSTEGEENRIELKTMLNKKSLKLKPRNACNEYCKNVLYEWSFSCCPTSITGY